MLPVVEVPPSVSSSMAEYRDLFCREEGFEHVSRYVTGLIVNPNKTLQGIHSFQVCSSPVSSRAMHSAVFEASWNPAVLLYRHRRHLSSEYQKASQLAVIELDWTFCHHDQGPQIYGVKKSYDYVQGRYSRIQTVMTASIANCQRVDGLELVIQQPFDLKEEKVYLNATVEESYQQMDQARQRLLELLHHQQHQRAYQKRTELALQMAQTLEEEGLFPEAHYAFDNGILSRPLTRFLESCGKHWVSELETSRHVFFQQQWQRIDQVHQHLKTTSPQSFRTVKVELRNGQSRTFYAFSKVLRLKNGYGKKRIVMVHEKQDLSDPPRFLITNALHWEATRILQIWDYRWAIEIFHEFAKQYTAFEEAQLRNQEAVTRHFCLSALAQSILQRVQPQQPAVSERFRFAQGQVTIGQKIMSIAKEVLASLLQFAKKEFESGTKLQQILDQLMPI